MQRQAYAEEQGLLGSLCSGQKKLLGKTFYLDSVKKRPTALLLETISLLGGVSLVLCLSSKHGWLLLPLSELVSDFICLASLKFRNIFLIRFFINCSQGSREFSAQGCELRCNWKPRVPERAEVHRYQIGGQGDRRGDPTPYYDARECPQQ